MHRMQQVMDELEEALVCQMEKGIGRINKEDLAVITDAIKDCSMTLYYYTVYKEMKEGSDDAKWHTMPEHAKSKMYMEHGNDAKSIYDGYMHAKKIHTGQDEVGKKVRMEELEECMCELEEMAKQMIDGMYPEEKQKWRVHLNKMINM